MFHFLRLLSRYVEQDFVTTLLFFLFLFFSLSSYNDPLVPFLNKASNQRNTNLVQIFFINTHSLHNAPFLSFQNSTSTSVPHISRQALEILTILTVFLIIVGTSEANNSDSQVARRFRTNQTTSQQRRANCSQPLQACYTTCPSTTTSTTIQLVSQLCNNGDVERTSRKEDSNNLSLSRFHLSFLQDFFSAAATAALLLSHNRTINLQAPMFSRSQLELLLEELSFCSHHHYLTLLLLSGSEASKRCKMAFS